MLARIKTWKKMEEEYGENEYGSIDTPSDSFTSEMEGSMPHHRIIDVVEQGSITKYQWNDKLHGIWRNISKEMIEEFNPIYPN